jgi:hypothetical protein
VNGRRRGLVLAGAGLLGGMAAGLRVARAQDRAAPLQVMPFSSLKAGQDLPDWLRTHSFADRPRLTRYALVEDAEAGRVVLHARAEASTAGLVRELRVDTRSHPLLVWRWKISRLVAKGDLASRDGDDFAARVYVTFDLDLSGLPVGERLRLSMARMVYGERTPLAVLCYVWDARTPRDTIANNAYTDRVRMVVAESGAARVGRWVGVERNVREDYRRAFGADPASVNSVIVSTDTDNTGESVDAWYGDISFRAA